MGKRKPVVDEREERFKKALAALESGASLNEASKEFHIPVSTLSERRNNITQSLKKGRRPILREEEETRFVNVSKNSLICSIFLFKFEQYVNLRQTEARQQKYLL